MTIPLALTAKNEESAIGACLESVLEAVRVAEQRLPLRFDVQVVCDDCTDHTAEVARSFARVRTIESHGGIVEAQRAAVREAPFLVFSDADIRVEPETLEAVCRVMFEEPRVQVAYPRKSPLPPSRRTLLAEALHAYNRTDGFQAPRRWFNGRLFAIRRWQIPTLEELRPRLESMARDGFYNFHAGLKIDDIYLSRKAAIEHGPGAIREVAGGRIWFRPPETFEGMYRTYRRMRMEIERLNLLFPETADAHARWGVRGIDRKALRRASGRDRRLWRVFQMALGLCRTRYRAERFYYRHLSRTPCPVWEPVVESKLPIFGASGSRA